MEDLPPTTSPTSGGPDVTADSRVRAAHLDAQLLDLYRRGLAVFDELEAHLRNYPSTNGPAGTRVRAVIQQARTPFEAIVGKVWAEDTRRAAVSADGGVDDVDTAGAQTVLGVRV